MSIDSPKSSALPNEDPGRRSPTSDALHSVDQPDEADRVPEGTITAERMREVLRRLDQGHYSSTEVQDKVAHAVLQDVGRSRAE